MQSDLTLLEQLKDGKVWDFPGGIHPPEQKDMSTQVAIQPMPYCGNLYIPLSQHIGANGRLLVNIGDTVKKGQPLTQPAEHLSLAVHASTSGVITDITQHIAAHPSGKTETTLILKPDNLDEWVDLKPIDNWQQAERQQLVQHIQAMGISGMGGAGFPTYAKLAAKKDIELLIINAVECEPYITADDMLMRTHASDVVLGAEILQHIVQSRLCIIAIEDNKPQAIAQMKLACQHAANIQVRVIPTKYPSGGEKQLIELLTGQQVPAGQYPADIGITMQNLGTTHAVKQAVVDGKPLIERVVTVTGEQVSKPANYWVKIGTPIEALLTKAQFTAEDKQRVIMGGPMMGFNVIDLTMPVIKTTNCILAPSSYHMPLPGIEQECIRCGMCAEACPAQLLPQQLQWFAKAKEHEKLEEYNLFDCIECGACAYVCPSQIPLVQYYRTSKAEIREVQEEKQKADKAKIRFEQRQERLEREKQERLQRHKEAAEKRQKAMANDTSAKDKIAAALARAKAKKQPPGDDKKQAEQVAEQASLSTANPGVENSVAPKDKVAAAIARAKAKKQAQAQAGDNNTEPVIDDKKDKVAAAIARAKAKKQAQSQASDNNAEPVIDDKKAKVAAAIARAKAKKQAQAQAGDNNAEPVIDDKKAKVAAAIARAKAKKQAQAQAGDNNAEPVIDDKKAKVAAAIARAKAKKAAKTAQPETSPAEDQHTDNIEQQEPALTAEQERKAKVAAAIARAKAKKQKNAMPEHTGETAQEVAKTAPSSAETAQSNEAIEPEATQLSAEETRKAKVAAAIAKAKAKKLAAQARKEQEGKQPE